MFDGISARSSALKSVVTRMRDCGAVGLVGMPGNCCLTLCVACDNIVDGGERMQGVKGAKEKTERISFRCSPEDKKAIYEEARKRRLSVSQYVTAVALGIGIGNAIYDAMERKTD